MSRKSETPSAPPGRNVWLLRHERDWTMDQLIEEIRQTDKLVRSGEKKLPKKSKISRLEQGNQYSDEFIRQVAVALRMPVGALFVDEPLFSYYKLSLVAQRSIEDCIRRIANGSGA